jgi:hypothetical protein
MSAVATENRMFFAENVKYDVACDALITLLCHSLKSERMSLWSSRFDDELDGRLAVDQLGPGTVSARLLMNNATAVAHGT